MKLIIFPALALLFIGILSMTGLGATAVLELTGNFSLNYINEQSMQGNTEFYLYDYDGNPKCFINSTAYDEAGYTVEVWGQHPPNTVNWVNATSQYQLFYDTNHYCPVLYQEKNINGIFVPNNGRMDNSGAGTFNVASSLGFIAIIVMIMAVGTIAGITIFGSGLSEFSVSMLAIGTALLTIWGILTYMAYPLILLSGFYMYIIYFGLTLSYCLGIVFAFMGGADM